MPPRSPWTDAVIARLSDGEWHTEEDLIGFAIPLVPDAEGYRRCLRRVNRDNVYKTERVRRDLTTLALSGKREMVRAVIGLRISAGVFERKYEDKVKYVRARFPKAKHEVTIK